MSARRPRYSVVRGMGADLALSRGVFMLPTMLTLANISFGYFAIVKSFQHQFLAATLLILAAAVLDMLDGLVARATGTASELGRELDSLADVVSFGVAPSLVACAWGLAPLGRIGWAAAFLFVACGAMRLARFNVISGSTDKRFFVGLPIPMAALLPVTLVLFSVSNEGDGAMITDKPTAWGFLFSLVAVSLLMVSNIRYLSFKDLHVRPQYRARVALALVLASVGIAVAYEWVLPLMAALFVAHGPFMKATGWQPAWTRLPLSHGGHDAGAEVANADGGSGSAQGPDDASASPGA